MNTNQERDGTNMILFFPNMQYDSICININAIRDIIENGKRITYTINVKHEEDPFQELRNIICQLHSLQYEIKDYHEKLQTKILEPQRHTKHIHHLNPFPFFLFLFCFFFFNKKNVCHCRTISPIMQKTDKSNQIKGFKVQA